MKTKIVKPSDLSGTLLAQHYVEVNLDNVRKFAECFQKNLTIEFDANPMQYTFPRGAIPTVVERYREALLKTKGSAIDLKTPAMQATLKELGIKATYKALKEWVSEAEVG